MWAGGGNGREGMEGLDFHLIKSIENESVPHPLKKSFSKSSLIHKNIKNSPAPQLLASSLFRVGWASPASVAVCQQPGETKSLLGYKPY